MHEKDIKSHKNRLLDMQAALAHLTIATKDSRKPVELDQTAVGRLSRMDALQSQAMQLETGRRRGLELKRVESALARIDSGGFGQCLTCGEAIEEKCLAHDPTFPTCIACARSPG
ncbi:MAG: TraR/DksA family transcriptional regulator [Rhodospirillales bacterium]|nr:TraR/DksA family transcriptional regulator [Rhodospirillales bacterium]